MLFYVFFAFSQEMEQCLQIFCYFMRAHAPFSALFFFAFWGFGFLEYFCLRLAVICRLVLVFGLVSGYKDSNYNKANHTHNYHHFQVLQPEFPLEFAGLLFKL